jgi:hypothetical protein
MDSRESLRPLQAVFINILMKRLMSVSPEWGQRHPCWVIVDEVHTLHRLSALYDTLAEGRKYGLKLVQGTQGKTQYEEYYDRLAKTMLAAPKLKIFFRCGEAESARWISDTIGEYEVERPKIGTTASVEDKGRDAINYSTVTEHKQAVSKEQIMSLPDLHGYWKYSDMVVPFRLQLAPVHVVARGFIGRELKPMEVQLPTSSQESSTGQPTRRARRRDSRKHEHAVTEKQRHLELPGGNDSNAAQNADCNQSHVPNHEVATVSEAGAAEMEVGAVDEELEQNQIEL